MKLIPLCFITLCLMASLPYGSASAESAAELYSKAVERDFGDYPTGQEDEFGSSLTAESSQGNAITAKLAPKNTCEDKSPDCVNILKIVKPASREIPWAAMSPPTLRTKVNVLWNSGFSKLSSENINNPSYLEQITYRLTEPTVGNAISAANREAELNAIHRTLADIRMMKIKDSFPESQPYAEAYVHCLMDKMSETPPWSYPAAQSFCKNDSTEATPEVQGPQAPWGLFAYHPAFDFTNTSSKNIQGLELRLSDLIFNEEGGYIPQSVLKEYRKDFIENFGDIIYKLPDIFTPQNMLPGQEAPSEFTVVDPKLDPIYRYSYNIHKYYNLMRAKLYAYCGYLNALHYQSDSLFENFFDGYAFGIITPDTYRRLSVVGFTATPALLMRIFSELDTYERDPSGKIDCDEFNKSIRPPIPYPSGTLSEPTPLEDYIKDEVKPRHNGNVPEVHRIIYFLARRTSLAKTLGEAQKTVEIIQRLSGNINSNISSSTINKAFKLIGKSIGIDVSKIDSALDQNLSELYTFVRNLYLQAQERTEKELASSK